MLTEDEYLEYKFNEFEQEIDKINKNYNESFEKSLDESLDREERKRWINGIIYWMLERKRYPDRFDREKARLIYRECEIIWRGLESQFKCEWINNDTLAVDINCKDLSFFCRMVASLYNLHAGMFSFSSSFTTHEAYTQSNHLIHISALQDGRGTLQFHISPKEGK